MVEKIKKQYSQFFPVAFALIVFGAISLLFLLWISIINLLPGEKIILEIRWEDVVVGLTIYLKTSVDFALVIALLMKNFPGLKNRLAIETGTALGNALGTSVILVIWYLFKEVAWLLGGMVILASLVLLKLAQTSLEHLDEVEEIESSILKPETKMDKIIQFLAKFLNNFLAPINKFLSPFLSKLVPELSFKTNQNLSFWGLLVTSFTVPFILGLDDFAGYVPLFNIVNVFGFGIGVFLGHCILNVFLFLNPSKTIEIVKNPVIAVIGSVVFIGLSFWGLYEAFHVLDHAYFHLL